MGSVYCAVRTDSLYKADHVSFFKMLKELLVVRLAAVSDVNGDV